MDESGIFGRLATDLTLTERKKLLDRLNLYTEFSREHLYGEKSDFSFIMHTEDVYFHVPWYIRLIYIIKSPFDGVPQKQALEKYRIARIGKIINEKNPEIYNYRRDLLLPALHEALADLKKAARFFYNALNRSINRDKGAFYAFLGSLELTETHNRLLSGGNPAQLAAKNPAVSEGDLRQIAFNDLEQDLMLITEDEKRCMYANVRSLTCLKALATFPFDRIILNFSFNQEFAGLVCRGNSVKETLLHLQDVLFSLKEVPSMALLESLFVFSLQEDEEDPSVDITTKMQTFLSVAARALMTIRNFNRDVPLTLMLRCITRDTGVLPQNIGGGEDWFVAYRKYWEQYLVDQFSEYKRHCQYDEMISALHEFFKGSGLKIISYAASRYNPDGFPLEETLALSVLKTFYLDVFLPDIHPILKIIMIEGEFNRLENRTQFTEIYNEFVQLDTVFREFESTLSPNGKYGEYYFSSFSEKNINPSKRRRLQRIYEEAAGEAAGIITRFKQSAGEMIKIFEGFIRKRVDGTYDVLANITKISPKNPNFMGNINNALHQLQRVLQFLDTIDMIGNVKYNGPKEL
jgi:hypothetical protein